MMMSAGDVNMDAVQAGLKSIKLLRGSVRDMFKFLADGAPVTNSSSANQNSSNNSNQNHGSSESSTPGSDTSGSQDGSVERALMTELQSVINNINHKIRDLESACTLLAHPSTPVNINLGNSGLLGQDPAYERTSLYPAVISAYRWSDRMHEYSSQAAHLLSSNSLKRSNQNNNPMMMMRGNVRMHPSTVPFKRMVNSVPQVDQLYLHLQRMFHGMQIEMTRPFGAMAVLKIRLDRVLKAIVLLQGAWIEWVLIKSFNEDFKDDRGQLDIWSESRYHVFQKITDHANAAMLHFFHISHPDLAIRSWLVCLFV